MKDQIQLFMWGYQQHFAAGVGYLANRVLERLGVSTEPKVFLVGVRRPAATQGHPVCVEPEDGQWPLDLFMGLEADVKAAIPKHPEQRMFYGDAPAMQDKPENIRRMVVGEQVKKRLKAYDEAHGVVSFCAGVYPVAHHYVATILQLPAAVLDAVPTLIGKGYPRDPIIRANVIEVCIEHILGEARNALIQPDPGRSLGFDMRPADEVIRTAAATYMQRLSVLVSVNGTPVDLFGQLNQLSAMMYEGGKGLGRILLVDPDSPALDYVMRWETPVPLGQTRWARKLLEMASDDPVLIASPQAIHGLGRLKPRRRPPKGRMFEVDFHDHFQWDLRSGGDVLLRSRHGAARLPQEPVSFEVFEDIVSRRFSSASSVDVARHWAIFLRMTRQPHGNMVVIGADAASEAQRLARQGTPISPTPLTNELLERACRIDGTILIDPQGICHAIGVILDGGASDLCTPSRGARYNSAIRYVESAPVPRVAIVVSDDKTVDIIPMLRPRLSRSELEVALAAFEAASLDDYHLPRLFLDRHRFYLDQAQCDRANAALKRLEAMPKRKIWIVTAPFAPDAAMDGSYLK